MVCNGLEVSCHEDLDTLAAPWVVTFVATALAQSRERYSKSIGEARLMVGNAIRIMCRAPKSRAGCHFAAAIGLRSSLESYTPTIPDWALDQHTLAGKKLGRGLDHFRSEGAKLVPPAIGDDPSLPAVGDQAAGQETLGPYPTPDDAASGSSCTSKRASIMLEEVIELHRFPRISPVKSLPEAGRLREAMVAAD